MSRTISEMTDAQIDAEIVNFDRHRTSKDLGKRAKFEASRERYRALLEARQLRGGFRLAVTLELIKVAASENRFLSYGEVAAANGVDWTKAYRQIGGPLGDLISWGHDHGFPVLSSIIVNQSNLATGKMDKTTLLGFIRACEALGYTIGDPDDFLELQQAKVFEVFGGSST